MSIGFWQIAIVVILVVLLFGRGKISDLMGDVAKGIKSFKKGMSDNQDNTKKEDIEDKNNSNNWKVTLIDTGLNTMTGGRLLRLKEYLNNQRFFLTYGDGLSNLNINDLLNFHKENKNTMSTNSDSELDSSKIEFSKSILSVI